MSDDTEDIALNFGEENETKSQKNLRHPLAVFFHLIFRILSIITYLLCGLFNSSFIVNFVVIIILLSLDFWTVKNITGRLLVGLRWWNYVDEDGVSHWVFESRKGKGAAKSVNTDGESRIFWLALVVSQVFWVVFVFAALITLSFKWFMVASMGVVLNGANLYGYVRCKMGSPKKLTGAASNFLGQQVLGSMMSNWTSKWNSQPTQQQS